MTQLFNTDKALRVGVPSPTPCLLSSDHFLLSHNCLERRYSLNDPRGTMVLPGLWWSGLKTVIFRVETGSGGQLVSWGWPVAWGPAHGAGGELQGRYGAGNLAQRRAECRDCAPYAGFGGEDRGFTTTKRVWRTPREMLHLSRHMWVTGIPARAYLFTSGAGRDRTAIYSVLRDTRQELFPCPSSGKELVVIWWSFTARPPGGQDPLSCLLGWETFHSANCTNSRRTCTHE